LVLFEILLSRLSYCGDLAISEKKYTARLMFNFAKKNINLKQLNVKGLNLKLKQI
jgi:hypothetical protein